MAIGTTNFPTSLDTADELVRATNSASTKLTSGINSSVQTILVTSVALFPSSGIIRINDEIISYTGTSGGNTFTGCSRGFEGTTATSHQNNDNVTLDITAASNNVKNDAIIAIETKIGTGASTPTANTVMRGTGTGTSAFGQVGLTTDVTGTLPAANGGTGANLSTTGGSGQVLMQTSVGGNVSVRQLAAGDISNGITGTGSIVLAQTPTILSPALTGPTADSLSVTGGAVRVRTTTNSDTVVLAPQGTGTNGFEVTLTPVPNLTSNSFLSLPNVTGTVITTGDTGTVTNNMLAGSIANSKLVNQGITINGVTANLGSSVTISTSGASKDFLINGDFAVQQRTTVDASGFLVDRWAVGGNVAPSQSTSTSSPTGLGSVGSMVITGGTNPFIRQRIESRNAKKLTGRTVTVSAWVIASSSASIRIDAAMPTAANNDFSSVVVYDGTPVSVGTSWTRISHTFIPEERTNWGLEIRFTRVVTSASDSFSIALAQVEIGSSATEFAHVPYEISLQQCMRYYQRLQNPVVTAIAGGGTVLTGAYNFCPVLRNTPSVTLSSTAPNNVWTLFDGVDTITPTVTVTTGVNESYVDEFGVTMSFTISSGTLTSHRPYTTFIPTPSGGDFFIVANAEL